MLEFFQLSRARRIVTQAECVLSDRQPLKRSVSKQTKTMQCRRGKTLPLRVRMCLVSAPGSICNATCATIAGISHARLVLIASGALSVTQSLPGMQLDLILLDANIPDDEVCVLLNWLADHAPAVRTLVARTTSDQCLQALQFGADDAVRRDELPARLTQYIVDMLATRQ